MTTIVLARLIAKPLKNKLRFLVRVGTVTELFLIEEAHYGKASQKFIVWATGGVGQVLIQLIVAKGGCSELPNLSSMNINYRTEGPNPRASI